MSQKSDTYLEKLKDFYREQGDKLSLQLIDRDAKSLAYAREMAEFRKGSHAKRMYDMAVDRFRSAQNRLLKERNMTQEQRDITFLDIDWARWYITALGGNLEETEEKLEKELGEWVDKLKL